MKKNIRINLQISLVINLFLMLSWAVYYFISASTMLQFALFILTLITFILSIVSLRFVNVTAVEFKKKRVYPIITMSLTLCFLIYLLAQLLIKHGNFNVYQVVFVILISLNLLLMLMGTCTRVIDDKITYADARSKKLKK